MASLQEPLLPGATRLREIRGPSSWAKSSLGRTSNARKSNIRCVQAVHQFTPSIIILLAVDSRTAPGKSRDFWLAGSARMDPALKQEIVAILEEANDLTIATVREDGYPQATTV